MTLGKYHIEYLRNKGFDDWVEASYERYIICPKCKSDKAYHDNFFSHYACNKCHYMDHADEFDWKHSRRTIIGN